MSSSPAIDRLPRRSPAASTPMTTATMGFTWLAPGYAGTLTIAADIDDQGRITGQAIDATGARIAFVATPVGP